MAKLDWERANTNRKLYPAYGYKGTTLKQRELLLKLGVKSRDIPKTLQGASNMIDRLLDEQYRKKKGK